VSTSGTVFAQGETAQADDAHFEQGGFGAHLDYGRFRFDFLLLVGHIYNRVLIE